MQVHRKDGTCRSCGGTFEITDASDDTLEVECSECGDGYSVETDAFQDGGVFYWPEVMARKLEGADREDS